MTKFIKLTNMLLNPNYINKILITPNKYNIYISNKEIDGYVWLLTGTGLGSIKTCDDKIEICKTKDPIDYKILSEWMDKQD